ncbi:hypothetical protein LDENG_00127180 [Lucifuga dentata]|nr:hypothetical protein LDENG_00127180 [Lucifuga dentata]
MNLEVVTATIFSEWETQESSFGEDRESLQSTSPESSLDSMPLPETCSCSGGHRELQDFSFGFRERRAAPAQRQNKPKMSIKRRMKASEREKMRMRSLAEALHQLRDYLPPDYSKRGQPLTKIQTLKYTIEYINKLSDTLSPPIEMDADAGEKVTESSNGESERSRPQNKAGGREFKGRGRGGWMIRGSLHGGRGMMKGFGPPGEGRGRAKGGAMNGLAHMRGMGRPRPYPDPRRHRGRAGPMGMGPCLPPPPPMHLRGPFPPMPRHPPPPLGHPGFRGRPPHPRGRGMPPPPGPPRHFHPRGPRGYHNGPASPPPHPPPGRGQRWPGPPGGRRF